MYSLIRLLLYRLWVVTAVTLFFILLVFWYFGVFLSCVSFVMAVTGILYKAQDVMLYYPNDPPDSRKFVPQPSDVKLPFETYKIQGRDGVKVQMFLIKQTSGSETKPTMIFFHGNAGNMGQRLTNVSGFYNKLYVNILMVEYRGYGMSDGAPSEKGLYNDAQTAFDFLMQRDDVDRNRIFVFGRSLGGAVAIDLASSQEYRNRVWAVIVENTFTSIPDMAKIILRWKCLDWLPMICHKNKYMSVNKIEHVSSPTLVICGANDLLVPPGMGKELYMRCQARCKYIAMLPGGGHDDTWTCDEYYLCLQQFLFNVPPLPGGNTGPYFDVVTIAPCKSFSVEII